MKKIALVICLWAACSFAALGQRVYLADTAFITDIGFGGAPASCSAPHMLYNGWNNTRAKSEWVADVFTVPADSTWVFDTVVVYEFKYGSSPSYTFLNCNLQVYNGAPGLGGSVIWGDTVTNVLCSTGFTGIYKVDVLPIDSSAGGLTGNKRPIMFLKLHLSPALRLTAGTYWLSWSASGPSIATNNENAPQKVLPGRVNPTGQMGRGQYGGTWQYLTDSGNAVGFNKIIKGSAAAVATLGVTGTTNKAVNCLNQNMPNPFSGTTTISFYLQQPGYIKMNVYNTFGQLVTTSIEGNADSGLHQLTFNKGNLPAGVYFYQLTTSSGTESKRMIMIE